MMQLFQNLKTGDVLLEELPLPACGPGQVLIRNRVSLVSLGTEKMLLDFGKAGWIEKARQQPDKVQQVLSKIKTDGLVPTVNAVRRKLDQPIALGYCSVGIVEQVGRHVTDLKIGDRVVSNGPHAEYVAVGRHLVASIPNEVSDETAAFTVVGSIGLQSVRLVAPTFGETVVVVGLGLIGLLTVQVLRAHGCSVVGYDFDRHKVDLARSYGAQAFVLGDGVDPVREVLSLNQQVEVDAVIITASTSSDEVISQAANMTRKRGRVVLLGVIGLDLKRSDFYEKEISFQVSCSYGPGRYEPQYEERGLDYPMGFVRWTENRNFQALLRAFKEGQVETSQLVTTRVKLAEASRVYAALGEKKSDLGILIEYPDTPSKAKLVERKTEAARTTAETQLAWLGAGMFASAVLLPTFQAEGFVFDTLGSRSGAMGPFLAKKYDFAKISSDYESILNDARVKSVVISTRHSSHGALTLAALKHGKNVFVEKPLALTVHEVEEIRSTMNAFGEDSPVLMVGFNRRFAPLTQKLKSFLEGQSASKAFVMTVNAGEIPAKHWTQDPEIGGGRLVGEGCHFIDLLRFLSGSSIVDAAVMGMKAACADTYSIQLKFANGDIGTIHYFANGSKDFSKERLEVFVSGKILQLDNFRSLQGLGFGGLKQLMKVQDKGHQAEIRAFKRALEKGVQPVPLDEVFEVSNWSCRLQEQLFKTT